MMLFRSILSVPPAIIVSTLFLTTTNAQVSFSPATSGACNTGPNYPCLGVNLCCVLPAVCIPDYTSGSIQYVCIDAAGFPVDNNGGSIPPIPSTSIPDIVIPTLPVPSPPVIPSIPIPVVPSPIPTPPNGGGGGGASSSTSIPIM